MAEQNLHTRSPHTAQDAQGKHDSKEGEPLIKRFLYLVPAVCRFRQTLFLNDQKTPDLYFLDKKEKTHKPMDLLAESYVRELYNVNANFHEWLPPLSKYSDTSSVRMELSIPAISSLPGMHLTFDFIWIKIMQHLS